MVTEVSVVDFRQNLGEMLNRVQYRNDSVILDKDGKPVAALVDAELFARIRRVRDRFDALSQRIAAGDKDLLTLAGVYPVMTPAAFWATHG